MTDTDTVEQITLDDKTMAAIRTVAEAPDTTYAQLLNHTWCMILGPTRWKALESLNPRLVAIPTSQWHTICQLFIDLGKRKSEDRRQCGLEAVTYGLDFMNIGPSSF